MAFPGLRKQKPEATAQSERCRESWTTACCCFLGNALISFFWSRPVGSCQWDRWLLWPTLPLLRRWGGDRNELMLTRTSNKPRAMPGSRVRISDAGSLLSPHVQPHCPENEYQEPSLKPPSHLITRAKQSRSMKKDYSRPKCVWWEAIKNLSAVSASVAMSELNGDLINYWNWSDPLKLKL